MGSLSGRLRQLERTSREILRSFELADGSRFYFDPTSAEMFLHACECLRNHDKPERPEPPELVKAVARAKERRATFREMEGRAAGLFPYDAEVLVERGEIVPRSLVVGRELGEPAPDLSE